MTEGAPSPEPSAGGLADASTLAVGGILRLTSSAVGLIGGLVVTVVVFRAMGPDSFGTYALALAVCSLTAVVAELGVGVGVSRMSAYLDSGRARSWATTALVVATAVGGGLTVTMIAAATVVTPTLRGPLVVAAPLIVAGSVSSMAQGFLAARRRLAWCEGITIGTQLIAALGVIVVVALGADAAVPILTVQVLIKVLGALVAVVVCWREMQRLPRGPRTRARDVVAFSMPLMVGGLAGTILQRSDVIMVGMFVGLGAVAWYEPTLRVLDVAPVVMAALGYYLFSVGASMVRHDKMARLRDAYTTITKWGIVLTMPLLMTMLVVPVPFLQAIFGPVFRPQSSVVAILALGYIINIAAGVNGGALAVLGATRQILVRSIALVTLNLAGNALLIPILGVLGGAIATTTVLASLNCVNSVLVWRMARLTPIRADTVRCLGTIAIATGVGWAAVRMLGVQDETIGAVVVLGLASLAALATAVLNLRPGETRLVHDLMDSLRVRWTATPTSGAADGIG